MKLYFVIAAGLAISPAIVAQTPSQPAAKTAEVAAARAADAVKTADSTPPATSAKGAPAAPPQEKVDSKPEALHYSINWASGLSVGEATLSSSRGKVDGANGWLFLVNADASIPGYKLQELANSSATADYCSIELDKDSQHGERKIQEKTTFDARTLKATRQHLDGSATNDFSIGSCAKDALTYIFFLRHELANGRLPAMQNVYYGSKYSVRVEYSGTQKVKSGDEQIEADRLTAHVKGEKADLAIEILFAKDKLRTPLSIRIPVSQGKINVELVR